MLCRMFPRLGAISSETPKGTDQKNVPTKIALSRQRTKKGKDQQAQLFNSNHPTLAKHHGKNGDPILIFVSKDQVTLDYHSGDATT